MGYQRGKSAKIYSGKDPLTLDWTDEHTAFIEGLLRKGIIRKGKLLILFREKFPQMPDPEGLTKKITEVRDAYDERVRALKRGVKDASHKPDKDCKWPIGHPNEKGFHYCGAAVVPGRPYCGSHCTVAYKQPEQE